MNQQNLEKAAQAGQYAAEVVQAIKDKIDAGEDVPEIERALVQVHHDMMIVISEVATVMGNMLLSMDKERWPKLSVLQAQIESIFDESAVQ